MKNKKTTKILPVKKLKRNNIFNLAGKGTVPSKSVQEKVVEKKQKEVDVDIKVIAIATDSNGGNSVTGGINSSSVTPSKSDSTISKSSSKKREASSSKGSESAKKTQKKVSFERSKCCNR